LCSSSVYNYISSNLFNKEGNYSNLSQLGLKWGATYNIDLITLFNSYEYYGGILG